MSNDTLQLYEQQIHTGLMELDSQKESSDYAID